MVLSSFLSPLKKRSAGAGARSWSGAGPLANSQEHREHDEHDEHLSTLSTTFFEKSLMRAWPSACLHRQFAQLGFPVVLIAVNHYPVLRRRRRLAIGSKKRNLLISKDFLKEFGLWEPHICRRLKAIEGTNNNDQDQDQYEDQGR